MSSLIATPAPPPGRRTPARGKIDSHRRHQQLRLLDRIHRRYATTTADVVLGPLTLNFTRIANPDTVLDEVAAEEDRRDRLANKTGNPRREPQHLPYWAEVWDSAVGLGTYLATQLPDIHRQSVLDLGCGQGLSGCTAAALGANVMFADLEAPSLLFAKLNSLSPSPATPGEVSGIGDCPQAGRGEGDLEREMAHATLNVQCPTPNAQRPAIRTRQLNWQTDQLNERFHLILGGDILYDRHQWPHLDPFWKSHLHPTGQILLAEPNRPSGDQFIPWIAARNWSLQTFEQPVPTRPAPIRILILTPA